MFIGNTAFSGTAGQLRAIQQNTGSWLIEGDIDGDGIADLQIGLTTSGEHMLGSSDFML